MIKKKKDKKKMGKEPCSCMLNLMLLDFFHLFATQSNMHYSRIKEYNITEIRGMVYDTKC